MADAITVKGSGEPGPVAAKVSMLEAKMKGLKAPEGFDLSEFISSFNRLYRLSLGGQMSDPDTTITWDLPDSDFRFQTSGTTLIKQMLGEYYEDYRLSDKPFGARVLGGDENGFRTKDSSLLRMTLGPNAWKFEANGSLAQKTLGNQAMVDDVLQGKALLELLTETIFRLDGELDLLRGRVASLEARA